VLAIVLAAAEPSKVPFYVAGIVLVVWAVVVSVIGLRQPDFPGSEARMRSVMWISVVLTVVTIGLAIHTSAFTHS
jgi:hypothetical protein